MSVEVSHYRLLLFKNGALRITQDFGAERVYKLTFLVIKILKYFFLQKKISENFVCWNFLEFLVFFFFNEMNNFYNYKTMFTSQQT